MSSIAIPSCQTDRYNDEKSLKSFQTCVVNIVSLLDDQSAQLSDLFLEYRSIFQERSVLNKSYTCRFDVSDDTPFEIRSYSVPFERRFSIKKEFQRRLEWRVIERYSSPYSVWTRSWPGNVLSNLWMRVSVNLFLIFLVFVYYFFNYSYFYSYHYSSFLSLIILINLLVSIEIWS